MATVRAAEAKNAGGTGETTHEAKHGSEVDISGRFTVSGMPLSGLVWLAYVGGQQAAQVEGGPAWSDTELWDIEAQMDDADTGLQRRSGGSFPRSAELGKEPRSSGRILIENLVAAIAIKPYR